MSDDERQHLQDLSDLRKYRHEIPNMADDDLNLYEYRLYGHYKRVCGAATGGVCYESTRKTAEKTDMSHPMVIKTRRGLEKKGYINCKHEPGQTIRVTLVDIWLTNMARYSKDDEVVTQFTPPGHTVYTKNTTTGGALGAPADQQKPTAVQVWMENLHGNLGPADVDRLHEYEDEFGYELLVAVIKDTATSKGADKRFIGTKYLAKKLADWAKNGNGGGQRQGSDPLEGAGQNPIDYDEYMPVLPPGVEAPTDE